MAFIWAGVSGLRPNAFAAACTVAVHFGVMFYSFIAALVILAMFGIIPLIAYTARGRWGDVKEASKGLGWVLLILFFIPAVFGLLLAGVMLLLS